MCPSARIAIDWLALFIMLEPISLRLSPTFFFQLWSKQKLNFKKIKSNKFCFCLIHKSIINFPSNFLHTQDSLPRHWSFQSSAKLSTNTYDRFEWLNDSEERLSCLPKEKKTTNDLQNVYELYCQNDWRLWHEPNKCVVFLMSTRFRDRGKNQTVRHIRK